MRKIWLLIITLGLLIFISVMPTAHADTATDNALNFLRAKQDAQGRINTGFSAPSQWSAIAFAVNNMDVATIKPADKSLLDFLLSDVPTNNAATDWENRILAIVAIGQDPTNFGGKNYVVNLETFYNNGQIGDTCSLNDDMFGLMALIASGNISTTKIKQDTLNFLISKQDATGGFGFSASGCAWYATSSDMTGAAIQAMVLAKNNGLTNIDLDSAIDKAKSYLIKNQYADGGFGYGSSDPDSTSWVMQAFNVLGMKDSSQAVSARTYLLLQQSTTDGGIMAFDYGTSKFVSNATTTSQAVIALSGKSWVTKIFDPSQVVTITPTPTTTVTPALTVTPTPTPNPSSSNNLSTPTPTVTPKPTILPTNVPSTLSYETNPTTTEQPTLTAEVLGTQDKAPEQKIEYKGYNKFLIAGSFAGLGVLLIFIYIVKPFIIRKLK
ncbi:terpene cyclase/mutase family protein [Candidatus Gottesmanbacteria bacterium]|nr:terpene cyclase/mutase family protein [Candidatus Gottesmanbacteria bacterium]